MDLLQIATGGSAGLNSLLSPILKSFDFSVLLRFGENDGKPQVSSLELTDATKQVDADAFRPGFRALDGQQGQQCGTLRRQATTADESRCIVGFCKQGHAPL